MCEDLTVLAFQVGFGIVRYHVLLMASVCVQPEHIYLCYSAQGIYTKGKLVSIMILVADFGLLPDAGMRQGAPITSLQSFHCLFVALGAGTQSSVIADRSDVFFDSGDECAVFLPPLGSLCSALSAVARPLAKCHKILWPRCILLTATAVVFCNVV